MEALFLTIAVIFLIGAIIFSWASFALHPELLDDAILSIGLSIISLGISQVFRYGLGQVINFASLLFLSR